MARKEVNSREDYLRIIYELHDDIEEKGIRNTDIANQLGISKASVSEMLRKLASDNLIKIQPYSKIKLTRKGEKIAGKLFDRHFTIKSFLKKYFKHNDDKAREEAHKLEHALSEDSVKVMNNMMEELQEELKASPSYVS